MTNWIQAIEDIERELIRARVYAGIEDSGSMVRQLDTVVSKSLALIREGSFHEGAISTRPTA